MAGGRPTSQVGRLCADARGQRRFAVPVTGEGSGGQQAVLRGRRPVPAGAIVDGRLCGFQDFAVDDGTYVHEFSFEHAVSIVGGFQGTWAEQVWWNGTSVDDPYHFAVSC